MNAPTWPDHLLSLTEWGELPLDSFGHYELADGVVWAPPPPAPHQVTRANLMVTLNLQLPSTLGATQDSE